MLEYYNKILLYTLIEIQKYIHLNWYHIILSWKDETFFWNKKGLRIDFFQTLLHWFFKDIMTVNWKGFVLICLLFAFGMIQSMNDERRDMCGIYGYNFDTKYGYYIERNGINDAYVSVFRYQFNISLTDDIVSLRDVTLIDKVKDSVDLCQSKSIQMNNQMYILGNKGIISVYDMNKEVYNDKYIKVPSDVECDVTKTCLASDYINNNIYMVCDQKFHYYSFETNTWIKGKNLNYNHSASICGTANNRFYVFSGKSTAINEYVAINENLRKNEFNSIDYKSLDINGTIEPRSLVKIYHTFAQITLFLFDFTVNHVWNVCKYIFKILWCRIKTQKM